MRAGFSLGWKIRVDFHVLMVANACKLPIVSKSVSVSGSGGEGEGAHLLKESGDLTLDNGREAAGGGG